MNATQIRGDRLVRRPLQAIALACAFGVAVAMLWIFKDRGWFAHDEGLLGQTAERILQGQVPHRDFADPYTGGLALFHALMFRLAGVTANALRTALALVATFWLIGCAWLTRSWLPAWGVALVALLIAVWSIPMYPAAMPSWYVLFLVTASGGMLVMLRTHPERTAFVSGLLIGAAALVKVTAIFGLVGAIWALIALRQVDGQARRGAPLVIGLALLTAAFVLVLTHALIGPPVLAHIVVPALAAIIAIAGREIAIGTCNGWGVDRALRRQAAVLSIASALPVIGFSLWLAHHGALQPFVASLRDVVGRRAGAASLLPPSPWALVADIPIVALLFAVRRWHRTALAGLVIVVGALVVAAGFSATMHVRLWDGVQSLLPAAGVWFVVWWISGGPDRASAAWRAVAVFAPICGFMALTRYPFAAPIYFLYVLPLLLLASSAAVATRSTSARGFVVFAIGLLAFGLIEVLPGAPEDLAMYTELHADRSWLILPRAHLLVPTDEQLRYQRLVAALDSLPPGPIWAGPDAPEVAFLSGRRDLNPTFFAFLAPNRSGGPDFGRTLLGQGAVAVVVDTEPSFSERLRPEDIRRLGTYFPRMIVVDQFHLFSVPVRP